MRRSTIMPSLPGQYANYTNCTIAQTQSGNIDQSRHHFEALLTSRILNSKTLTDNEKVKFLKIIENL
jgi:hypothetical protein